jgi:hypothetical protein
MFSCIHYDGFSVACVAGLTAVESLGGLPVGEVVIPDDATPWHESDFWGDMDIVGVTDVSGGCVIVQPWAFRAAGVLEAVTAGTFAYGMYANPKSGNQGMHRRGRPVDQVGPTPWLRPVPQIQRPRDAGEFSLARKRHQALPGLRGPATQFHGLPGVAERPRAAWLFVSRMVCGRA